MQREAKIAERLARSVVADSGDVPYYFNISDFFEPADGSRWIEGDAIEELKDVLYKAMGSQFRHLEDLVRRELNKKKREIREMGFVIRQK